MTFDLEIGGTDYTPALRRQGSLKVSSALEDGFGVLTIDSARFSLNGIKQDLSGLISEDSISQVLLGVDGNQLFDGRANPAAMEYRPGSKILDAECISFETAIIRLMDQININEFPQDGNVFTLPIYIDGTHTTTENRSFVKAIEIIAQICAALGIAGSSTPSSIFDYATIGYAIKAPSVVPLPDWSAKKFIDELAALFNCYWAFRHIGAATYIYLFPKITLLTAHSSVDPIVLPLVRNSLSIFPRRTGYDLVIMKMGWFETGALKRDTTISFINNSTMVTKKEVESGFRAAIVDTDNNGSNIASIAFTDPQHSDYIIKSTGPNAADQLIYSPKTVLQDYWNFELSARYRTKGTYNLIGRETGDGDPLIEFSRAWLQRFTVPGYGNNNYILKAEADLNKRTVQIETVSYELP